MSSSPPADNTPRQPCPHCAEPIALEARICHHCHWDVLVDVCLTVPSADPRARYQIARTMQAMPGAPSLMLIQAALAAPRPAAVRGVTRAFAHEAVARLAALGVRTTIEIPPPPDAEPSSTTRKLLVRGTAVLGGAGVTLLGWYLGIRTPPPRAPQPKAPAAAPAAAVAQALSARDLAQRSLPSTVSIRCRNSVGSGFFVARDLVLTNAHVLCGNGQPIEVILSDDRKLAGRAERRKDDIDLGLVRVAGADEPPLALGDVADLAPGDKVMIIGSPVGLEFTVHEGSVSSLQRNTRGVAYVQLDAKVNPGNSGGPVIDGRGRVVGIVSLKVLAAEGISLALPINYAYSPGVDFVPAPSPGAILSTPFRKMLARATEDALRDPARSGGSLEAADLHVGGGRAMLIGAEVDRYHRLVVRVLRAADNPPKFEEIAVNVWRGTERFCTMKGDVASWKLVDTESAASMVPRDVLNALGERRLYVGDSPLRWDLCNRDHMVGGIQIELAGGHPARNRLVLGR